MARSQNAKPALKSAGRAGHSLGEYCVGGRQCLKLLPTQCALRTRGELMDAALPAGQGGMAAILGLTEAQIRVVCAEASSVAPVDPANFNAPGQVVIAGAMAGIEKP